MKVYAVVEVTRSRHMEEVIRILAIYSNEHTARNQAGPAWTDWEHAYSQEPCLRMHEFELDVPVPEQHA